jgi:hypothetical protein
MIQPAKEFYSSLSETKVRTALHLAREGAGGRPPRRCFSFELCDFALLLFSFSPHRRITTSAASACNVPLFLVLCLASRAATPCARSRPPGQIRPQSLLPVIPWVAGAFPKPRLCRKTETSSLSSSDPLGLRSSQTLPSVDPLGPWSIHTLLSRAQQASLRQTLLLDRR